ncbi:MAG: diacylglycerol kinase family protein [bacterium]
MSYFYVYDKFVQEGKFDKELIKIEHRLTDIGIQGKIGRLALFKQADELIKDEVKRGAETIVVVGNDDTFYSLLQFLPQLNVTVGFIPLGEPNRLAEVFGIPAGVLACDPLSSRILETFDLGLVNGQYFLSSVEIYNQELVIDYQNKYKIPVSEKGAVEIRNLGSLGYKDLKEGFGNPRDGLLDVILFSELPKSGFFSRPKVTQSILPLNELNITGKKQYAAIVDGAKLVMGKMEFGVLPKALKMIVGKNRMI